MRQFQSQASSEQMFIFQLVRLLPKNRAMKKGKNTSERSFFSLSSCDVMNKVDTNKDE